MEPPSRAGTYPQVSETQPVHALTDAWCLEKCAILMCVRPIEPEAMGHCVGKDGKFRFADHLKDLKGAPICPAPDDIYLCVGGIAYPHYQTFPRSLAVLPSTLFQGSREGDTVSFYYDQKLVRLTLCNSELNEKPFEGQLKELQESAKKSKRGFGMSMYSYDEDWPEGMKRVNIYPLSRVARVWNVVAKAFEPLTDDLCSEFTRFCRGSAILHPRRNCGYVDGNRATVQLVVGNAIVLKVLADQRMLVVIGQFDQEDDDSDAVVSSLQAHAFIRLSEDIDPGSLSVRKTAGHLEMSYKPA